MTLAKHTVTIDSNMQYNGKEVIRLCNVSFENGVRRFKLTQAADVEQALRAAYDHGYQEDRQTRSDEITSVLGALKVFKDYFQNTDI